MPDHIVSYKLERSTAGVEGNPNTGDLGSLSGTIETFGQGGLPAGPSATDTAYSDPAVPNPSYYYRLTATTADGVTLPYNVVKMSGVSSGAAILQVMYGGAVGAAGAGVTQKSIFGDAAGNVMIAGQMVYSNILGPGGVPLTSVGGQDMVIAKQTNLGQLIWSLRFGNVSNDSANSVAVDSSGYIWMIGSVSGGIDPGFLNIGTGPLTSYGGSDVALFRFQADGTLVAGWPKLLGGSGADTGLFVAIDASDNVYIAGTHSFFGTGLNCAQVGGPVLPVHGSAPGYGQQDVFLVKLNSSGVYQWGKSFGGSSNDVVTGLSIGGDGNPVISATTVSTDADFGGGALVLKSAKDGIVAKYASANGALSWLWQAGSALANGVASDPNGYVIVGGDLAANYSSNLGGGATPIYQGGGLFMLRLSPTGTFLWQYINGNDITGPHIASVAVDSSGNGYAVGEISTGLDFGNGWLLGKGGSDLLVFKVLASGPVAGNPPQIAWAKRGSPYGDRGTGCCVEPTTNSLLVLGDCGSVGIDLGATQVIQTAGSINNAFWIRISP